MRSQRWISLVLAALILGSLTLESDAVLPDFLASAPSRPITLAPKQHVPGRLVAGSWQQPGHAHDRPGGTGGGVDADGPGATLVIQEDKLWEMRYAMYQELVSAGSEPLLPLSQEPQTPQDDLSLRLLHGRADAVENAHLITALAHAFPDVPPVMVAAAIAEQASDIERLFGVDALEKAVLALPGLGNMSIGIAQLRPTEAQQFGLDPADLFEPQAAIRGMFIKVQDAGERIDRLQDPAAPLSPTDRAMLLSLAQNNIDEIDIFFELGGDWEQILAEGNNSRVMRYYLVHLDWLVSNGWALSDKIDLQRWRETVFSAVEVTD